MEQNKTRMYRSKTEAVLAFSLEIITIASLLTGMLVFAFN
ncbi:hypothetical protein HNR74_004753 [Flammeovirga kamogawensis]|nr:hypothetical protein [Flammeovirga kamogawensis]